MLKEQFRQALRARLGEVPLKTRQTWDNTNLLVWWSEAQKEDSYLRWERAPGDVWQHVKGMCPDLIGPNAIH